MTEFTKAMDHNLTPTHVLGENMSPELTAAGVGDPLVALFAALVRGIDASRLRQLVFGVQEMARLTQEVTIAAGIWADLVVLIYQTRDCRGGKGERALFYTLFDSLAQQAPETTIKSLLPLVPEYGYYKDLFFMWELSSNERLRSAIIELVAEQLHKDEASLAEKNGSKPSLLAKYAPREKRHFQKAATALIRRLYGEAVDGRKRYRKLLVELTAKLDVPEVKMCGKRWAEISVDTVPSLCLARSRRAFLNERLKRSLPLSLEQAETGDRFPHDPDRIACRRALSEAMLSEQLKGKQMFPHEIIKIAMSPKMRTASTLEVGVLEAQWRRIVASVRDVAAAEGNGNAKTPANLGRLVALVDVSGSMCGEPMQVAIAMGLLVAELAAPEFANRILTFETRPHWHQVDPGANIVAKVSSLQSAEWEGSTNFEAALECILQACVDHKVEPDDVPDLIVFSDMQFDSASDRTAGSWETQHNRVLRRFRETGLAVCGKAWAAPSITYWNLRGNTKGGYMAEADKPGVRLLSGFSPALLRCVLEGDEFEDVVEIVADGTTRMVKAQPTPYETMRKAIDDSRYDPIRQILSASTEEPFTAYNFVPTVAATVMTAAADAGS